MGALIEPVIRDARAEDLPALHALVERAYRGDEARGGWSHEADILGGPRIDTASLSHMLHDAEHAVLVAERDGTIVGSVDVADRRRGLAYLGMLSVTPDLQGSGLGRHLVRAAEQVARERLGAVRLEMTVIAERDALIGWYERLGFARTGEVRPFPPAVEGVVFLRGAPPEMVVLERTL